MLIFNQGKSTFENRVKTLGNRSDSINMAMAYFTESELVHKWNKQNITCKLIVCLQPPTSYDSLFQIQDCLNVEVFFFRTEFHSKVCLFYKNNKPVSCILGSSNFTKGGLYKNREANIELNESSELKRLDEYFRTDLLCSPDIMKLQPEDLKGYKQVYDDYIHSKSIAAKKFKQVFRQDRKGNQRKRIQPCLEARKYFEFWRIVDTIKEILNDSCKKYFPGIPQYLVLDHFWHWIKAVWYKSEGRKLSAKDSKKMLPMLFKQYYFWQKKEEENDYLKTMNKNSRKIFNHLLSVNKIDKLSKSQAVLIYKSLHSSNMRIQRFNSDKLFITTNTIAGIRKSLKYLLYSQDDMDIKIHKLLMDEEYKINELGTSGVQEINGWMFPERFPIRNQKADTALKILGFNF